jgi:hypothetical protein
MTPEANFTTSTAGVIDTGGKFAAGTNLQPVSTTPVANNGNYIRLLTP